MYHKKYGKMTFSAWLAAEMNQSSPVLTFFVGILLAVACIAVRVVSGSPYRMMLELGISDLVPPVWLMSLLRFVALATAGCAGGLVLGYRNCGKGSEKYRTCLLFLLMVICELCWYPAIFCSGLVTVGLLLALLGLLLGICTVVGFLRISKFSGIVMTMHCVWLCYLLMLSFSIFLRN